jgi:hypothetical protein
MTTTKTFPPQREGQLFLTDGGIETEIMYKWGFELPHFAMYPLLDDADAMEAMRQRGARIRGAGALTPTPSGVRRCGRSSGVRTPTCG